MRVRVATPSAASCSPVSGSPLFGIKKKPSAPLLRLALHPSPSLQFATYGSVHPIGLYYLSATRRQSNSRFARGQRNLTLLHKKKRTRAYANLKRVSCRCGRYVITISQVCRPLEVSTARIFSTIAPVGFDPPAVFRDDIAVQADASRRCLSEVGRTS